MKPKKEIKVRVLTTLVEELVTGSSFFCTAESVLGYLLTGLAFDDNLLGNCRI